MATVLNLDKRLETIISLCDVNKVIADIGCDHGLVTAELILEEIADTVIATEISVECLNKAIMLANKINILPYISFRECDGFKLVTKFDKVNQAIIAGLGGQKMIEILEGRPKNISSFVLNPMSDVVEVRKYLLKNRFKFLVDELIKVDGKYYNIMKVVKGRQKLSELEIYFGYSNFRENYQTFYEYLNENYTKLSKLKERFGELNEKNEEFLVFIDRALHLFDNQKNKNSRFNNDNKEEVMQNKEQIDDETKLENKKQLENKENKETEKGNE